MRLASTLLAAAALASGAAWPQSNAVQVASGLQHNCALTSQGGVKCWGTNFLGQLGDSTTDNRSIPTDVAGLGSGVKAVSAGSYGSCAITEAGALKCWGQVGIGVPSHIPADVPGLGTGVTEAGVGFSFACALASGGVKCWGANGDGQLGDATTIDRAAPAAVAGLESGVAHLSVGSVHACAVTTQGAVKCWGSNHRSQLGISSTDAAFSAVPIANSDFAANTAAVLANNEQSCGLTQSGVVRCWGVRSVQVAGQAITDLWSAAAESIAGLQGIASLGHGQYHNCAITTGGAARCWGWNGAYQLGDGTQNYSYLAAIDVPGLSSGVRSISGGAEHTCAVRDNGRVRCWGVNDSGQLGDGTLVKRPAGVNVMGFGPPASSYQGLWWRSPAGSESGWGLNIAHQGDTLFATWFTYDEQGNGMWLVMSNGVKSGEDQYTGALYRTSGPRFDTAQWSSAAVTRIELGTATLAFTDDSHGTFTYTVNGRTASKPITRLVYATPTPACGIGTLPGPTPNYQDLWWRTGGGESGWGVNLTHQGDVLFATWFTYDVNGFGMWLVMSEGRRVGSGTWSGVLHRTTGPPYNSASWNGTAVKLTPVGEAIFTFTDADNGIFTYTVNATTQSKPIARMRFATPASVCR